MKNKINMKKCLSRLWQNGYSEEGAITTRAFPAA